MKKYLDLIFPSGLVPSESAGGFTPAYSVPAIQHVPTNTYMMDSTRIAQFLESTYPDPPVSLTSELGREIEAKARATAGRAFHTSVVPREIRILLPRSQEYYRSKHEASLGHRLEDLLSPGREEESWNAVDEGIRAVGELMQTNKADGPFVLGAQPSFTDFFIAGSLQSVSNVDEGVFQKIIAYPGFKNIYEACLPYMEKKD